VNIEVGCLRAVLKRSGDWVRLQTDGDEIEMLPERDNVGRALTAEEEAELIGASAKSRSRVLLPFVRLAIETGARYGTIQRLQWKNVDFAKSYLTFGKDKTAAGSGRTIPLTPRAFETLRFWADQFPTHEPDHFVFPSEKCGGTGSGEAFGFTGSAVYESDPTKPAGSIKTAWRVARKRAGLPDLRIHDLRHTAVSRMIAGRTPLPMIARIVGWSAGTLAKMSARYGHFSLDEMRSAMESISGKSVSNGYPRNSPRSKGEEKENVQ
jgi:integrase